MTNSYHEGFSKTASAHGVDPAILLKFAEYCKEAGLLDDVKTLGSYAWKAVQNPRKAIEAVRRMADNGKTLQGPEGTKLKEILQNPTVKSVINGVHGAANWWGNLDQNMKRGLGGMALTGLGSMLFTDGNLFQRLIKGLGYGTLGGAAAYGLSRSGLYDKGIDYIAKNWGKSPAPAALPAAEQGQQALQSAALSTPGAFLNPNLFPDYQSTAKALADQQALGVLQNPPTP